MKPISVAKRNRNREGERKAKISLQNGTGFLLANTGNNNVGDGEVPHDQAVRHLPSKRRDEKIS